MRPTLIMYAATATVLGAMVLGACGRGDPSGTGVTLAAPTTTSGAGPAASTTTTVTSTPATTRAPVTDPPSTIVTFSGLLCADEWYSGTATFAPEAVGHGTIDDANDEWWQTEGRGLGWDRDDLEPMLDDDGRTTRYLTATGRPVLLLTAEETQGGGRAIGSWEGCSER